MPTDRRSPPSGFRVRWDRVGFLVLALASIVALSIRAAVADPPEKPARPAPVAATLVVPKGSGGCPAEPRVVREAPAVAGHPELRTVALTFDDGPGAATPQVLEVLRRERVRASFFPVGREVADDPETVRAIAREGHLVGNHTWSHRPPARTWDAKLLGREIDRDERSVRAATGEGTCWFRPPEGIMGGVTAVTLPRRLAVALWSVDTWDWKVQQQPGDVAAQARTIRESAAAGLSQAHPVVIMHDGGAHRQATVAALPGIVADYRAAGYRFVRLDGR